MALRLIYGVGINDADYTVQIRETISGTGNKRKRKLIWICPFYSKWVAMLERGYSRRLKNKHKTYKDCSVCEEWWRFSNFKAWMERQNWEDCELDKDLLVPGNKLYSPETCLFVSHRINSILVDSRTASVGFPLGVSQKGIKYTARVVDQHGKRLWLGTFNSLEAAHKAWQIKKIHVISDLAAECEDAQVSHALLNVANRIKIQYINNEFTCSILGE